MHLKDVIFKRKYSVNLYKNLRLKTLEMSMFKDFINDKRGDPYTVLKKEGDIFEKIENASYFVSSKSGGYVNRLLGGFFPYCSYDLTVGQLDNCSAGFRVDSSEGVIEVGVSSDGEVFVSENGEVKLSECKICCGETFSVNFRGSGISLYINRGRRPVLIADYSSEMVNKMCFEEVFSNSTVSLFSSMKEDSQFRADFVEGYLCGGLSHADMKPVKYEDGTPIFENGRVYMSMSSRLEAGGYQSIISFNPTLCDFKLEGALFFDTGDGKWCSDVASSIVYDRTAERWMIWVCSFSHGHILARAVTEADPRFGIQVIDVKTLEPAGKDEDRRLFKGFQGDEDPDLCLIDGKWHLTVCRLEPGHGYHYYHFVSDQPLDGFEYVDKTLTDGKTGGLITKFEGKYYFVCGTDFHSRALYDIYDLNDFSKRDKLQCDYDDGGFRGWGTVFRIPFGSRKKYIWVTFDRHNASGYNWSYGNIYVYEADIKN